MYRPVLNGSPEIQRIRLPVIGTPEPSIGRDQMAYANKRFLEFHAANQSFFLKKSEDGQRKRAGSVRWSSFPATEHQDPGTPVIGLPIRAPQGHGTKSW